MIKDYDLFGMGVALDGDADVLAVGLYGDDGWSRRGKGSVNTLDKTGSV